MGVSSGNMLERHPNRNAYVVGTIEYRLDRLVGESMNVSYNQRRAVFWATRTSDDIEVIIKFFIECGSTIPPIFYKRRQHPILATVDVRRRFHGLGRTAIEAEVQGLEAGKDVKGLPHMLERSSEVQGPEFEYPGGVLDIVAMTRLPGYPLDLFQGQLEQWEVGYVKGEVLRIVRGICSLGHATRREWPISENTNVIKQLGRDIWWFYGQS
ncbi:hypothetical protein BDV38DRAFT_276139 [Aspergillus pseudotamarii]|uniref:Uncharacterized protein n=1 Tax=Aspergillus pseudotamarii TaxID=132259 RepID=A0A5N6SC53_ASPPS|nr:uncharacterized protein BDV38DRAFT_276139 [Aspergillus pseudotamarii]KAE8131231.1 hypothetical protein BDV38DRAFT_276139 [Aspergillus pseudotamarii]